MVEFSQAYWALTGMSPEEARKAKGLHPNQAAYIIYVDGHLTVFQGHHFRTGKELTADTVEQAAQDHIDFLVEQALAGEVVDEIIEVLAGT